MGSRNHGYVIGRIGSLRSFDNSDGSKKVFVTVMADRDFKSRMTGERESDAVQLSARVRPETQGLGIYDMVGVGDLVAIDFAVRAGRYVDKQSGEVIYTQDLVVDSLAMLESRSVTQARRITSLERQLDQRQGNEPVTSHETEHDGVDGAGGPQF